MRSQNAREPPVFAGIAQISAAVFGGLYYVVRLLG